MTGWISILLKKCGKNIQVLEAAWNEGETVHCRL